MRNSANLDLNWFCFLSCGKLFVASSGSPGACFAMMDKLGNRSVEMVSSVVCDREYVYNCTYELGSNGGVSRIFRRVIDGSDEQNGVEYLIAYQ